MSLTNFMMGAQWCCRGDGCHTRLDVGGGGVRVIKQDSGYIVNICSSKNEQFKLHRSLLGMKGGWGGAKTAL